MKPKTLSSTPSTASTIATSIIGQHLTCCKMLNTSTLVALFIDVQPQHTGCNICSTLCPVHAALPRDHKTLSHAGHVLPLSLSLYTPGLRSHSLPAPCS